MDKHIESMLSDGWEIMTETSHSGNSRGFRPFAKRDTITVSFRRAARFPPVEKDTSDRRHGHIKDTISCTSVACRAFGSDQGLVGSMDYFREAD